MPSAPTRASRQFRGNRGPWAGATWLGRKGGGPLGVVGAMCAGRADGFHSPGNVSGCGRAAGAIVGCKDQCSACASLVHGFLGKLVGGRDD